MVAKDDGEMFTIVYREGGCSALDSFDDENFEEYEGKWYSGDLVFDKKPTKKDVIKKVADDQGEINIETELIDLYNNKVI